MFTQEMDFFVYVNNTFQQVTVCCITTKVK